METNNVFCVGDKVKKCSGKPFKSGEDVGNVESIGTHPYVPDKLGILVQGSWMFCYQLEKVDGI